ncbi:MAG: hypothetical protein ACT4PM_08900 [Gemmatimonadales bacterium]
MDKRRRTRWMVGALALGATGLLAGAVVSRDGNPVVTLPAGTQIVGALQQTVSTDDNEEGDRVTIRTDEPIQIGGYAPIPSGVILTGEITEAESGGRLTGSPKLTIRFYRMEVGGREYPITTVGFRVKGKSSTSRTAKEIGGGAVVGGIIGAIAGDVVKGAAVGAVLGTGVAIATDGKDIELPAGRRLRVQLAEPVTVEYEPEPRTEPDTDR